MFEIKVAIVLCLSALVLVKANDITQLDGFALFDTYSELNNYLEGQVKSTDDVSNIEAVSKLPDSSESARFNNQEDLSNAVWLFQSLRSLNTDNNCTANSARVLKNNYYAAFGYPEAGFAQGVEHRKINQIVKNFCLSHAKACHADYLTKWEEASKNMDPEVDRVVSHMFERLLEEGVVDKALVMNDREMLTQISRGIINLIFMQNTYTSDLIKEMAHEDPDVQYLTPSGGRLDQTKVNELATRYLVTPCKSYMSPLEDIFEPAEVDSLVGFDVESDNLNFHQAWAKYRYCSAYTEALEASAYAV